MVGPPHRPLRFGGAPSGMVGPHGCRTRIRLTTRCWRSAGAPRIAASGCAAASARDPALRNETLAIALTDELPSSDSLRPAFHAGAAAHSARQRRDIGMVGTEHLLANLQYSLRFRDCLCIPSGFVEFLLRPMSPPVSRGRDATPCLPANENPRPLRRAARKSRSSPLIGASSRKSTYALPRRGRRLGGTDQLAPQNEYYRRQYHRRAAGCGGPVPRSPRRTRARYLPW